MVSNEIIGAAREEIRNLTRVYFALGDLLLLAKKAEFSEASSPRQTQYNALIRRLRALIPNAKLLKAIAADFPKQMRHEGLSFGHFVALYGKENKFKRRIVREVLERGLTVAETRDLLRRREQKVKTIQEDITLAVRPEAKPPKFFDENGEDTFLGQ